MTDKPLVSMMGFTSALTTAILANHNNRFNNMAMLRALNKQPMMEIINQDHMTKATIAYESVLAILTRAVLSPQPQGEDEPTLILTADRFQRVVTEAKKYLLIVNS